VKLLLDTHALIWWLAGDGALSQRAREAVANEDNSVAVSAASAMEVATKFCIGKLPEGALLARDFESSRIRTLPNFRSPSAMPGWPVK